MLPLHISIAAAGMATVERWPSVTTADRPRLYPCRRHYRIKTLTLTAYRRPRNAAPSEFQETFPVRSTTRRRYEQSPRVVVPVHARSVGPVV